MDEDVVERLVGEFAETRRHFDVIAEGLRSDIRLVAEGVAAMTSAMTAGMQEFRSEVKDEFTEVRSMIRLSYAELDRRLQTVERALVTLEERVQRLESAA